MYPSCLWQAKNNQSINPAISQSINPAISQSIKQSIIQLTDQSTTDQTNKQTNNPPPHPKETAQSNSSLSIFWSSDHAQTTEDAKVPGKQ